MAIRIQLRRGTTTQWSTTNPILAEGEIGLDTTLDKFKIGDGVTAWDSLSFSGLTQSDLASYATTTSLSNHESDTTNVHGIADTAALATQTYADSVVSSHSSDTTNVHGISDTANIVLTNDARLSDSRTPTSHASSHSSAGSDPITISQSQVTNLTTDLSAKASLASPELTGVPTAPTATAGTNTTQIATTAFVLTEAANAASALVDSAPATLNTLNELAAALGDDPNYATTISTALGNKQPLDADLTAIAALTGSTGFLKKTAEENWSIDTNTYLTGNQIITLSGDVSGSGTTSIEVTVADDSHNHIISNVDGLQDALNLKAPLASPTFTGTITLDTAAPINFNDNSNILEGKIFSNNGAFYIQSGTSSVDGTASIIVSRTGTTTTSISSLNIYADTTTFSGRVVTPISTNQQTASYTLVLSDASKLIEMNVASGNTVTVPPNSSVAFPVGTKIDIIQTGAGETSFVAGSGVTLNSDSGKLKINAQWAAASLVKRGTDTWVLIGALKA